MMKKIISLLSVFAMVLTMFSTVALADENNKVFFEDVTPAGAVDTVVLKLVTETNLTLNSIAVTLDLTQAINAGATFDKKSIEAATFNVNTTQKAFAATYTNVDGGTGRIELGELTINLANVEAGTSFAFPAKRATAIKDSNKVSVISSFTDTAVGYTVTKPVVEDEEPEYGVSAAQDYYYSADGGVTKDIEVKAWDVVAENDGTGFVSLYFSSASENVTNKKYTAKHSVEGETAVEFKALMLNAPADLTCALTAAN